MSSAALVLDAEAASLATSAVQILRRAIFAHVELDCATWILAVDLVLLTAAEAILANVHVAIRMALKEELETASLGSRSGAIDDCPSGL
jgi:hypothetical protein